MKPLLSPSPSMLLRRRLALWFGAATLGSLGAPLRATAQTKRDATKGEAAKAGAHRTVQWAELIPPGWDPRAIYKAQGFGRGVIEGSAEDQAALKALREIWDNAPTRLDLDGAKIRIGGYLLPLEQSGRAVKEFLLVPYFGACIHTPPPPANQIIHGELAKPQIIHSMDPVWASGTLRSVSQASQWGVTGYRMDVELLEPYQ